MHFSRTLLVAALIAASFAIGCQRKPSHPYAMLGTIDAAPDLRSQIDMMMRRGAEATLRMTLRTSPDVSSIVMQRRWMVSSLPFSFGIGRDKLSELKTEIGAETKVFVTALLEIPFGSEGLSLNFVGWTRSPVTLGSTDLMLLLDRNLNVVDAANETNYPTGGWFSSAVAEDAPPPGMAAGVPGPFVFGGSLDVPEAVRHRFSNYKVFVIATFRPEGGAPELLVRYDYPVFPFKFSLHENNRMFGSPTAIEQPFYIVAILDGDGRIDTKEDQIRVVTPNQIQPGTSDLAILFPVEDKHLTRDPHGAPTAAQTNADETVCAGTVILPPELAEKVQAGSVLYVSARDAKNQLILSRRIDQPSFPHVFELTRRHSIMGTPYTGAVEGMRIRAVLSASGDVLQPSPSDMETSFTDIKPGQQDVVLTLRPKS